MSATSLTVRAMVVATLIATLFLFGSLRLRAQANDPVTVVNAYYLALKAVDYSAATALIAGNPSSSELVPQFTGLTGEDTFGRAPRGPDSGATVQAPSPKDKAPTWAVRSYQVVNQTVRGDRATISVDETYTIHGFPTHVLADIWLRGDGDRWRIDGAALASAYGLQSAMGASRESPKFSSWLRMRGIGVSFAALAGALNTPEIRATLGQQAFHGCIGNLKNIGTACEMYSTDFSGRYPPALSLVTPNYLRAVPLCPSVAKDTYSAAFVSTMHPADAYTVVCSGSNHAAVGVPANFPQYNSTNGLVEKP